MSLNAADRERLFTAAHTAMQNAYAPYSNFRVGAAVLTAAGNVYSGCNLENASYGLTNCAEHVAIAAAVTAEGGEQMRLKAVAVVTDPEVPCSPCGACRQVIAEFGPEAVVLYQGESGVKEADIRELLPEGFRLR